MEHITVRSDGPVLRIALNRPQVRNAFDERTIAELREAFAGVGAARAVVLRGEGPAFCAGADISWMERASTSPDNQADAEAFAALLAEMHACPVPLIGVAHRAAFGGAIGFLAVCDSVIARPDTMFRFSEARLGLVPAVIAPYVVRKIGVSAAAHLFACSRAFDAQQARDLGLVHMVADDETAALDSLLADVLAGGPSAQVEAKSLLRRLSPLPVEDTASLLARVRASDEALEGFSAFRDKRPPSWAPRTP